MDDINDVKLPSITDGKNLDVSLNEAWVDVPSYHSTPKPAEHKTLAQTPIPPPSEVRTEEAKMSGSWDPLGAL
jgi:hypothetical protein